MATFTDAATGFAELCTLSLKLVNASLANKELLMLLFSRANEDQSIFEEGGVLSISSVALDLTFRISSKIFHEPEAGESFFICRRDNKIKRISMQDRRDNLRSCLFPFPFFVFLVSQSRILCCIKSSTFWSVSENCTQNTGLPVEYFETSTSNIIQHLPWICNKCNCDTPHHSSPCQIHFNKFKKQSSALVSSWPGFLKEYILPYHLSLYQILGIFLSI